MRASVGVEQRSTTGMSRLSWERPIRKRSLAGLNAINFFQAEMVGVVLPALGAFLNEARWRYDSIGIATALAGFGTLLLQTGSCHYGFCLTRWLRAPKQWCGCKDLMGSVLVFMASS